MDRETPLLGRGGEEQTISQRFASECLFGKYPFPVLLSQVMHKEELYFWIFCFLLFLEKEKSLVANFI